MHFGTVGLMSIVPVQWTRMTTIIGYTQIFFLINKPANLVSTQISNCIQHNQSSHYQVVTLVCVHVATYMVIQLVYVLNCA